MKEQQFWIVYSIKQFLMELYDSERENKLWHTQRLLVDTFTAGLALYVGFVDKADWDYRNIPVTM